MQGQKLHEALSRRKDPPPLPPANRRNFLQLQDKISAKMGGEALELKQYATLRTRSNVILPVQYVSNQASSAGN